MRKNNATAGQGAEIENVKLKIEKFRRGDTINRRIRTGGELSKVEFWISENPRGHSPPNYFSIDYRRTTELNM